MSRAAALALALVALAPPATAGAGTLTTRDTYEGRYQEPHLLVEFVAGSGEANDVLLETEPDGRVRITDRGAPLTVASSQCEATSPHAALCRFADRGRLALGDGDDRATVTWPYGVTLLGEAGDDLLVGTAGGDALDGGAGRDRMAGGAGDDRFSAPEPGEVVDGGEGSDVVSFAEATQPVTVALADFPGVERAHGGPAADRITGTDAAETLDGGHGDDVLDGRGGDDLLVGRGGRDLMLGGDGDDELRSRDGTPDAVGCGGGDDLVRDIDELMAAFGFEEYVRPDPGDRLGRDCEAVATSRGLPLDARVRGTDEVALLANPCWAGWVYGRCRGTITASAAGVARKRRFGERRARLGFRLPPSAHVRVRVRLRVGRERHHTAWTAER